MAWTGGCVDLEGAGPGLRCAALGPRPGTPAPAATDTLEVVVVLERRAEPLELLVRVDPVAEEGIVRLPADAPPTVAAAGATVGTSGAFAVCVSPAPGAIVFQGAEAPHDKAWARVSTDRPVKAVVRLGGEDGVTLEPALSVAPGRSERGRWTPPEGTP